MVYGGGDTWMRCVLGWGVRWQAVEVVDEVEAVEKGMERGGPRRMKRGRRGREEFGEEEGRVVRIWVV